MITLDIKTENMLHAVLWYDNENGYASRVVDQVELAAKMVKKNMIGTFTLNGCVQITKLYQKILIF